ncbi:GAP family protein [Streptomyces sp. NPDC017546]|uniref:GAP family protein n=1 Tax=Streptomyces sp. NPDC017546 TaxID=3365001 RepID=UPI0037AFC414
MLAPAVGIAISPVPLIAIVLMLSTPRARANGTAFAVAWVVTLGAITTVVLLFGAGAGADTDSGPATWTAWLKLALGVLFLLLAVKQWRGRPAPGHEAATPKWMTTIDSFTPGKSAAMAAVLAGLNPKNLALAIGGAVSIASSPATAGGEAAAAALFVMVGSLCTLLPLGVYFLGGERAVGTLQSWKAWMGAHNAAIMTVLLLVLGAKYLGDAISALTS